MPRRTSQGRRMRRNLADRVLELHRSCFRLKVCGKILRVLTSWEANRLVCIHLDQDLDRPDLSSGAGKAETVSLRDKALADHLMDILSGAAPSFPYGIPPGTAFQRRVWEAVRRIPYKETATYSEIAGSVGCRSPRAVGQALKANPWPILIPCHRVIAKDSGLGGYSLGIDIKRLLLAAEKGGTLS